MCIRDRVWKGVEKVLYADGKRMHFKKWDDFLSFEGKSNTTGIIYQDGKVYINCTPKRPNGGIILSVKLPNNKNNDHWNYETRCLCDPTKYCRIVRKKFSSGWCYYVQLIQEGIPPQKHVRGTGRIGIDIGTSTVATVSETACHLDVLGDSMAVSYTHLSSSSIPSKSSNLPRYSLILYGPNSSFVMKRWPNRCFIFFQTIQGTR